ncbi:hypothetical protein TEA_007676 [Camellia sinensis var. sinensis]|uniref:EF-hand domain-containing protein n=1 Tax=Camellia sinensis var. sinensis TaxID=542762 RepID=A0A4V3WK47_CAMSN|nr:hypothetical protein TEA_007676 [Camellia sinensis var. sinensis]
MASSSHVETSSNNIPYQGLDCHDENALKKHVEFFDRNKDGVVYPWETFQGFRAIGCNIFLSTFASIFINVGLSGKTRPGKCPSLCFPIVVKNIPKAMHGSDSGVYDSEGRICNSLVVTNSLESTTRSLHKNNGRESLSLVLWFVPSKFEEIFCKHAHTNPNALTSAELKEMRKANREPKDYGGWLLSFAEWTILYTLCKDKNGLLQKDTVRGLYDGSLFEQMAEKKASAGKKKHA